MLRCMLSPNDSCDTPICSERNRESSPSFAAITWSIEGPLGPRPVNIVPVIRPLIEFVWPFPMPLAAALSTPLSTWKSPRNGASGERQGVIAYCEPSSEGIQYRSGIPFPLNQITKRLGIAFPATSGPGAAYAVPCELNIETNGGRP